jgi:hypothetical protein
VLRDSNGVRKSSYAWVTSSVGIMLIESKTTGTPGVKNRLKSTKQIGVCTCNSSTLEAKAGESQV